MKIGRIIRNIQAKAERKAAIRKENNIKKYFHIHDTDTYGDSFNQMYTAREVIANYAKKNNVSVDVYDARKYFDDDFDLPVKIQRSLEDKLEVTVTDKEGRGIRKSLVSANTEKTYPKMAQSKIIVPVSGEDTQIARNAYRRTEDNFLRNLYRHIEQLTNEVKKLRK